MQETITIPIINLSNNSLPAYATAGSSGMDIRAHLTAEESLMPLERKLIPTGLFVEDNCMNGVNDAEPKITI